MAFIAVAPDQASARPSKHDDGSGERVTLDYFGRSSVHQEAQAFVITMKSRTLNAHFHPVDQFQILLGQEGATYQRHPIAPLVVHFADAFTPYGPLRGEEPPLRFFTLRSESTGLTAFMPEDKELLLQRGRRNMHEALADPSESVEMDAGATDSSPIFAREADGLEAIEISGGPGAELRLPAAPANGQYSFVAAGSFLHEGGTYPRESLAWHTGGHPEQVVTAGPRGCRIAVLRFPVPATNETLTSEDRERVAQAVSA